MKPCSAWCRPEEGVHVWLESMRNPIRPSTMDDARRRVGIYQVAVGTTCVSRGVGIRWLSVDTAEAPIEPGWDVTFLATVQVAEQWAQPSLGEDDA